MSQSHMVIYQTSDGEPGSRQFDEISAAVAFVEELRNRSGVDVARIFKLEEVKFEFKKYYQVLVVGDDASESSPAAVEANAPADAATRIEAPAETPAEVPASDVIASDAPATDATASGVTVESSAVAMGSAEQGVDVQAVSETNAADTAPAAEPVVVDYDAPTSTHDVFAAGPVSDSADADQMAGAGAGGDSPMATRRGLFGR